MLRVIVVKPVIINEKKDGSYAGADDASAILAVAAVVQH